MEEVKGRTEYSKWFMGHLHLDKDWDDRHILLYDRIVDCGLKNYSLTGE